MSCKFCSTLSFSCTLVVYRRVNIWTRKNYLENIKLYGVSCFFTGVLKLGDKNPGGCKKIEQKSRGVNFRKNDLLNMGGTDFFWNSPFTTTF